MTLSVFEKNLELLQTRNPVMALKLLLEKGEGLKKKKSKEIFPKTDAALLFFSDLLSCLENVEKAIDQKKTVVVFEKDPLQAQKMLWSPKLSKLLLSNSFFWHLEIECREAFCLKMAWTYLFCTRAYFFSQQESHIQRGLENAFSIAEIIALDYKDYGLSIVKNIFQNKQVLARSFLGRGLQLSKVAIICGAGPSLETFIPFLKKIADKAWLFAGGSSLEVFKKTSLEIDFACAVDPKLYLDLSKVSAKSLLYSLRCNPETLTSFQGTCYVFPGSGESLLEQKLWEAIFPHHPSIQESGWNVGNFMTTCALACGIDHIILVGMDMIYEEDREYANSVAPRKECKTTKEILDKDGKIKSTREDFLAARDYYEALIKAYPEACFYKLGKSGLAIEGIKEIEKEQIMDLIKNGSKEALFRSSLQPSYDQIDRFFIEFKLSFYATQKLTEILLQKAAVVDIHRCLFASLALEEHDLEQELFFQLIFVRLWEVWQWKILGQMSSADPKAFLKKLLFLKDVTKVYEDFFKEMPC